VAAGDRGDRELERVDRRLVEEHVGGAEQARVLDLHRHLPPVLVDEIEVVHHLEHRVVRLAARDRQADAALPAHDLRQVRAAAQPADQRDHAAVGLALERRPVVERQRLGGRVRPHQRQRLRVAHAQDPAPQRVQHRQPHGHGDDGGETPGPHRDA
jgi:hypothetical protein